MLAMLRGFGFRVQGFGFGGTICAVAIAYDALFREGSSCYRKGLDLWPPYTCKERKIPSP